jgi:hypothetical protein
VSESSSIAVVAERDDWLIEGLPIWTRNYVRQVAIADFSVAVVGAIAVTGRAQIAVDPDELDYTLDKRPFLGKLSNISARLSYVGIGADIASYERSLVQRKSL